MCCPCSIQHTHSDPLDFSTAAAWRRRYFFPGKHAEKLLSYNAARVRFAKQKERTNLTSRKALHIGMRWYCAYYAAPAQLPYDLFV